MEKRRNKRPQAASGAAAGRGGAGARALAGGRRHNLADTERLGIRLGNAQPWHTFGTVRTLWVSDTLYICPCFRVSPSAAPPALR